MREAIRDDFLLVKRSAGLTRLLKSVKWGKFPIALFREENTFWLIVFTEKSTSISFFSSRPNGDINSAELGASELLAALRTGNPSLQNSSLIRNIVEIIPLSQVISLESSTKTMKGKQNGMPEANDLIYCLTIDYWTSTSSSSEKQRKLHFGSTEHNSIIEWLTILEQKRIQCRPAAAPSSAVATSQAQSANEVYTPLAPENIFPVKLTQFPEGCTAYNFRTNTRYRLRFDNDALALLSADESSSRVIVSWPLTLVRGFGKPLGSQCEKFWFEAGRRCPTGVGVFRFESNQAVQMYQLAHQRVSRLNQRIQRVNSAPPSYTDVMRDPSFSSTDLIDVTISAAAEDRQAQAAPPPLLPPKTKSAPSSKPQAPRPSTALHNTPSITLPSRAGVPLPPVPSIAPLYPSNLLDSISESDNLSSPLLTPPIATTAPLQPSAPPPPMYESGQSFMLPACTTDKQCVTDGVADSKNIGGFLLQLTNVLSTVNNRGQRPNSHPTSPTSPGVSQSESGDNEAASNRDATSNGPRHEECTNATTKVRPTLNATFSPSVPSSPPPPPPEACLSVTSNRLTSSAAPVLFRQPIETNAAFSYDDDTVSSSSSEWNVTVETALPSAGDTSTNTGAKPNQSNAGVYAIASQWQPSSFARTSEITNFDLIKFDSSPSVPVAPRDAPSADTKNHASLHLTSPGSTVQATSNSMTYVNCDQKSPPPIPQRPPNMKLPTKLPR